MSYIKFLEKLKVYKPKKLIDAQYVDNHGNCCAIGAVVKTTITLPSELAGFSIGKLIYEAINVKQELIDLGLTCDEACRIQRINDCFDIPYGDSRNIEEYNEEESRQRYNHIIHLLEDAVAVELAEKEKTNAVC
jgi:hypothetical protein